MTEKIFQYNPPAENQGYRINILVDDPNAWIVPWAQKLHNILASHNPVRLVYDVRQFEKGDFAFLLGCTRMLPPEVLALHRLNLVVHESALPQGKGFSPVQWQVLEGANVIPVVLFEAVAELDAGPIYLRDEIVLDGSELLPELREKQGQKTLEIILRFLECWPDITPQPQSGPESIYRRRKRADDQLDVDKPLKELFRQLRVVDNTRYPAWFVINNKSFKLIIKQMNRSSHRNTPSKRESEAGVDMHIVKLDLKTPVEFDNYKEVISELIQYGFEPFKKTAQITLTGDGKIISRVSGSFPFEQSAFDELVRDIIEDTGPCEFSLYFSVNEFRLDEYVQKLKDNKFLINGEIQNCDGQQMVPVMFSGNFYEAVANLKDISMALKFTQAS